MAETSLEVYGQIPTAPYKPALAFLLDVKTGLSNQLCRTARCEKTHIVLDQTLREVQQSSLVKDRDNGYRLI